MSLNKFTTSADYLQKQYLNIGCNDIKCSTLEVGGATYTPVQNGQYNPAITSPVGTFTEIFAYYSVDGSFLEVSGQARLFLTATQIVSVLTIPYPIGFITSPVGTRPCGVLTSLAGASDVGALADVSTTGDAFELSFIYSSGTAPANGTACYINFHMKVFGNPIV